MLLKTCRLSVVAALALLLVPSLSQAQGTLADYQRAMTLRDRYENLAVNVPDQARWVANTQKLWYRKSVKGGHEFVLVDAGTRTKEPAFDHGKLAAALSAALGRTITPHELPFNQFTFVEGLSAIEFQVTGGQGQQGPPQPPQPPWRCTLADYKCAREERAGRGGRGGRGGGGGLTGPVRPPSDINGGRAAEIAGRQIRSADQQLQRRHPGDRQTRGHAVEHRWLRRRVLRSRVAGLVARFEENRRLQGEAGPPPLRSLRGVVSGGSAAAEALHHAVRQAGRRPGCRNAGALSPRHQETARRQQRAVPECLRHDAARLAQRQFRGDVRVQPARAPALSRHLDRCRDRRGSRPDRGGAENVLLLFRQEVPP